MIKANFKASTVISFDKSLRLTTLEITESFPWIQALGEKQSSESLLKSTLTNKVP